MLYDMYSKGKERVFLFYERTRETGNGRSY